MILSVLMFVLGIVLVQQLPVLPDEKWFFFVSFLTISFACLRHWRLMFFTSGLLWALCFANFRLLDKLPEHLQGESIPVEGKVIGLPQYDERKVRFDFVISKPKVNFPNKIRISWYFPKRQIKAGQHWKFNVKLKRPHGRFNPGGFDYERWLFMQNIGATGYVRNKPPAKLIATDQVWQNIDVLRQIVSDKLLELANHTENIAVIKALTLGERNDISNKQWEIYRNTGTAHLLAISGLHIGLISGLVYFLILKLAIKLELVSPQTFAAIFAIIIAIFYSAMAGFSLPTQRTLLMLTTTMAAITWQRNIKPLNTLALTIMAVLILDPLAVLSASFWLSFSAVALIIYCLAGRLGKSGYWKSAIKIHWSMAIGLAPLLLYYFNQVSIISPIANLVTVPVVSLLIVPACLLAVLLLFISPQLAELLFVIINKLLQGLNYLLSLMSDIPYASVPTMTLPYYVIALSLIGVFVILLPKGMPARWLGFVLLLPLLNVDAKKTDPGDISLTVLDVDQGLSAVIETSNHVLIYDTGAKYSDKFDMGDAVVIPFLKRKGINTVDTLLISHADNDHIGGAESVLEQLPVVKTITSAPEMLDKYTPILCQAGQFWTWDQVEFEVLSPGTHAFMTENNNSCVLKVSSKSGSLLLTGDIEADAENWLVNKYSDQLKSNVLIAPHHGSKTSSTLTFLEKVNPNIIIIPSGYRNRYSFPHQEVLHRYRKINASWFNTADNGAISINLKKEYLFVSSERIRQAKYWH